MDRQRASLSPTVVGVALKGDGFVARGDESDVECTQMGSESPLAHTLSSRLTRSAFVDKFATTRISRSGRHRAHGSAVKCGTIVAEQATFCARVLALSEPVAGLSARVPVSPDRQGKDESQARSLAIHAATTRLTARLSATCVAARLDSGMVPLARCVTRSPR